MNVDGLIDEVDGKQKPLYAPYWKPVTGHPYGETYIYVNDDKENVYVSLDITMDNTDEYGLDWAEITAMDFLGRSRRW